MIDLFLARALVIGIYLIFGVLAAQWIDGIMYNKEAHLQQLKKQYCAGLDAGKIVNLKYIQDQDILIAKIMELVETRPKTALTVTGAVEFNHHKVWLWFKDVEGVLGVV